MYGTIYSEKTVSMCKWVPLVLYSLSHISIFNQFKKGCVSFGLKKWSASLFSQSIVSWNYKLKTIFTIPTLLFYNPAAGTLSAYKYGKENPSELCCLVVDCGYSFTHLIPFVQGKKVTECLFRIDMGGKVLTNHLKDIISYRCYSVIKSNS